MLEVGRLLDSEVEYQHNQVPKPFHPSMFRLHRNLVLSVGREALLRQTNTSHSPQVPTEIWINTWFFANGPLP